MLDIVMTLLAAGEVQEAKSFTWLEWTIGIVALVGLFLLVGVVVAVVTYEVYQSFFGEDGIYDPHQLDDDDSIHDQLY